MRAATHIAEMKDLAERVNHCWMKYEQAAGDDNEAATSYLATAGTLGAELAELVVHFNLTFALSCLSVARTALDDPAGLEESVQQFYSLEGEWPKRFDHDALKRAAIEEIDQAIHDLYEEPQ